MTPLSVALVCGTILVLWWRIEPLVARVIDARAARAAAIEKGLSYALTRILTLVELRREVASEPVASELPSDLRMEVLRESEEWAQADTEKQMRQLYAQATGTPEQRWNTVRKNLELSVSE